MEPADFLDDSGDLEPGGGREKRFNSYAHILPVHCMEREPVGIFACQLLVQLAFVCICITLTLTLLRAYVRAAARSLARSPVCDGASALVTAVVVYLRSVYKFISFPFNTALPDPRSSSRSSVTMVTEAGRKTSNSLVVTHCFLTQPKD